METNLVVSSSTSGTVAHIAKIDALRAALDIASTPTEVRDIEARIAAIEDYMRKAGLYSTAEIRPVNEGLMLARWKLGRLLSEVARDAGGRPTANSSTELTSFSSLLKRLGINPQTAMLAQRIGTLPGDDLRRALDAARDQDILCTYTELINRARPYWYQANRKARHEKIAAAATGTLANLGPFPLIYADPPWKFEIYSEKGGERTPDQHYPTLTDQEIIDFKVAGKSLGEIVHRDAALMLWATSSNLERALGVLTGWGFTFKSSAVWVKDVSGLGLIFRNQHEVLLYGTRGNMPGPQFQPSSVFMFPRGEHSAKPPEIRSIIERMYPGFGAPTRLELFARGDQLEGWTHYGFEAGRATVAG